MSLTWIVGDNGAGKSKLLREIMAASDLRSTAYYHPSMNVPGATSFAQWLEFNHRLADSDKAVAAAVDALLPAVKPNAWLNRLSTGEAKRCLLWSLLRRRWTTLILDEPYEHLSPAAKGCLTQIISLHEANTNVIVATNQEIPHEHAMVVTLDS